MWFFESASAPLFAPDGLYFPDVEEQLLRLQHLHLHAWLPTTNTCVLIVLLLVHALACNAKLIDVYFVNSYI